MGGYFNKNSWLHVLPLCFSVVVSGCLGYQPLYENASLQDSIADVQVQKVVMDKLEDTRPGARRTAQLVTQHLTQTFTEYNANSGNNGYLLNVVLREEKATLAVRRDATEQRLQLHLNADILLQNISGDKIFATNVTASAPYNVEDTPYSTDAGRQKARQSAVKVLSEEIIRRISLFLHNHNNGS